MDKNSTYELKLKKTFDDVPNMSVECIMEEYKKLGCDITLFALQERLQTTCNDLAIADALFQEYNIDDANSLYAKELIDLGMLEIIRKQPIYGFTHFGLISEAFSALFESKMSDQLKIERFEENFREFFKMAKRFKLDNFDALMYQIDDGLDMQAIIVDYLDNLRELARSDASKYKTILSFIERFQKQFPKVNPYLLLALQYEQAQCWIATGSSKGEKLFLDLLQRESDKTDVILHYALSYLDDDETKAQKIVRRYAHLMDKKSDAYEIVQEMMEDITHGRTKEKAEV